MKLTCGSGAGFGTATANPAITAATMVNDLILKKRINKYSNQKSVVLKSVWS